MIDKLTPFQSGDAGRHLANVQFRAFEVREWRAIDFHAWADIQGPDGRTQARAIAGPLEWLEVPDMLDGQAPAACCTLTRRMAKGDDVGSIFQTLMDDLWRMGYRPADDKARGDVLGATEAHLEHITGLLDRVLPVALRKGS